MTSDDLPLLLIIDDDPDQLALNELAVLRAGGFRVMTAEDAMDALEQLDARDRAHLSAPDLVLSDLKMPEINAIELAYALRQRPDLREVPVVILTSSGYRRDHDAALAAGIVQVFQKPMRFPDLVELMKTLPSYLPAGERRRHTNSDQSVGVAHL